jgi:hypothetical protein
VLYLEVGVASVRAEARRAGVAIWQGEATYASVSDLTEVVAGLAAAPTERCKRLRVTLDQPPAQSRVLKDLPSVRERELAALVANQAGRFFRRNGAPLVTDATWVANGSSRVTHAAAVEEPLVLAIVAGAAQAGLRVESITTTGPSSQLQLLPEPVRAARQRAARRAAVRAGVVAAAVWVVAMVLFGIRLGLEQQAVDRELAAAEAPMAALRDVKREMRTVEAMLVALADARRQRGQALATLARVNAALPDSAVLTSYAWRSDGSGVVAGGGRRAGEILAALERREMALPNPRIEGTVVRETFGAHDWERFTITFGPRNP